MRPNDQGFEQAFVHRGGGLAQPADPLENGRRYTDPILFRNGRQVQTKGYCTDVYFDAAMEFIDDAHRANRNFFVYLPTNAPHGPFHDVPEDLRKHYMTKQAALGELIVGDLKGQRRENEIDKLARIAAMITNVDANVGRLFAKLDAMKLTDNTLVIFLVDNGPNSRRFVGQLRGSKTNVHEGGVRSPLWVQWPSRLKAGYSRDELAAHIDLMPTILDACQVPPSGLSLDGKSLLPLLLGKRVDWSKRTVVIQSHRGDQPTRYGNFMIRSQQWKLLHASGFGRETFAGAPKFELYNLDRDPGEAKNLIDSEPAVAARLQRAYDAWFDDVSSTRPDNYAPPRIQIGTPHENPTVLTRQDWRGGTWAPNSVGYWELNVAQPGVYDIKCIFDPGSAKETAELTIGSTSRKKGVQAGDKSCQFRGVRLADGDTRLLASLAGDGESRGVYQVTVTRLKNAR